MYKIVFTHQAIKDRRLIAQAGLETRTKALLDLMAKDPFASPPSFEKPVGDLNGFYSRRINRQHRLVYRVEGGVVSILRMWTHYE